MRIVSKIVKENEVFGYLIKDEDLEYPISKKGLFNKELFNLLLAEGYVLHDTKEDLRFGSLSIKDLPEIKYNDVIKTPMDLQDILDMEAEYQCYTQDELFSKIDPNSRVYIPWNTGDYKIYTREDLIKFIDRDWSNIHGFTKILPINFITHPQALWSPEEFVTLDFRLKQKLKERRILDTSDYVLLCKWLMRYGLTEGFTAKEVMDCYFQWGFDGIRLDLINKYQTGRQTLLSNQAYGLTSTEITYMTAEGSIYRNQNTSDLSWKPYVGEEIHADIEKEFRNSASDDEITPVLLAAPRTVIVTEYRCEHATVFLSESELQIKIEHSDGIIRTHNDITLQVKSPIIVGDILTSFEMSIFNQEVLDEFKIKVLATFIEEKLQVPFHCTSIDALRTQNVDKEGAVRYILMHPDYIPPDIENIDYLTNIEENMELKLSQKKQIKGIHINKAIYHLMHKDDYEKVKMDPDNAEFIDIVDSLFAGNISCDATFAGQNSDATITSLQNHINYLTIAYKYMGYTFPMLYKLIDEMNPMNPMLEFSNGDVIMKYSSLRRKDATIRGFKADVNRYRIEAAKSNQIMYVSNIYKELGQFENSLNRHIAVDGLMFSLITEEIVDGRLKTTVNKKAKNLYQKVTEIIDNYLSDNFQESKADNLRKLKWPTVAEALFTIASQNKINLNGLIKDKNYDHTIKLETTMLQKDIISELQVFFESTVTICNTNMRGYQTSGSPFNYYFVNATITPTIVIPSGSTIPVYPFSTAWYCWIGAEDKRNKRIEAEQCPATYPDGMPFLGYSRNYQTEDGKHSYALMKFAGIPTTFVHGEPVIGKEAIEVAEESPMTLAFYWKNSDKFKAAFPIDKKFINPPHLAEVYINSPQSYLTEEERQDVRDFDIIEYVDKAKEEIGTSVNWGLTKEKVYKLTKEDALRRVPQFESILNLKMDKLIGDSIVETVKTFKTMNPEDIIYLDNIMDVTTVIRDLSRIPVLVTKQYILYHNINTKEINVFYINEIDKIDRDVYAIDKISNNKYIVRQVNGLDKEVTL